AIDAPEARQTCTREGAPRRCGQAAAVALSDRIGRRPVRCEQTDIDRYRRIVARCSVGGVDLGGWLVGQGLAVAYRRYGRDYVAAEAEARESRRGLWAGDFVMPWDWRASRSD
ncbi:MAG: thermonuclease family protein, partial [Rhodobacterales bacterium]|nr:thermonuclease family protein [Rhodobacterales bacterium]MDX5499501.1 thermonuclease family protein [Rhodobacterales bacterium]